MQRGGRAVGRRRWEQQDDTGAAGGRQGGAVRRGERVQQIGGGIRTGDDVFKAVSLGARAVLLGRPYAYGLGLDGQAGVEHVIRSLLAEFDLTLALSGHTSPGQLTPDALTRPERLGTPGVR